MLSSRVDQALSDLDKELTVQLEGVSPDEAKRELVEKLQAASDRLGQLSAEIVRLQQAAKETTKVVAAYNAAITALMPDADMIQTKHFGINHP